MKKKHSRILEFYFSVGLWGMGRRVEVEEEASQPEQDSTHASKGCYLEQPQSPQKG